jgi:ATP-dependent RNA/DNA helicase IGHMBP2
LINANFPKEILNDCKISTVDSFQGSELDFIIISTVRSNSKGKVGFIKDPRRLNVALSRPKEGLIIIGDLNTLC